MINRPSSPGDTASAIALMLLNAFALSIYYVSLKKLTVGLPSNQATFLCKLAILISLLPWCLYGGVRKNLATKKIGLHATRGTFSIMGSLCFTYALANGVRITDAVAISFLEHILIVLIGLFYFREKLSHAKVVLLTMGFAGSLFVVKPGFAQFNYYYLFLFLALIFWAVNNISIKILSRTEHSKAQIFYAMLFSSILSLPLAMMEWRSLSPEHLKYLSVVALSYLLHLVAFFRSFKLAEMSIVMPFEYTRLIFSGILGYILFSEVPDNYSILGYLMITFGGVYLLQSRAKKRKSEAQKDQKLRALGTEYEQV
jgi:S-adenosylmethionine uptake transporter